MKIPVTAIVSVKNEEKNIYECLDALQDYKEVIVVDSKSTDETVNIAKTYRNVSVISFKWNGKYPKKKQWILDNVETKNDWILFVDGDEVFNDEINKEILEAIKGKVSAFYLSAAVWFMGEKLKHGREHSKIILMRRSFAHFPEIDDLHITQLGELEGHYQPIIKGKVGKIKNKYDHNNKKGLADMLEKHNAYSTWQAEVNKGIYGTGIRSLIKKVFHYMPFMPTIAFLDSYIFHLGFLDGQNGYNYAKFRQYYYWQTKMKRKELKNG